MESSPPDGPLCSSCGLKPARVFLTTIIDGVKSNCSLCDECASVQQVTTDDDGVSIRDAKCFYCRDKAAGGTINQKWELPTRKQTMHYYCIRCIGLYQQFFLEALGSIPDCLSLEDQFRRMETMVGEVDSRVRSAISE